MRKRIIVCLECTSYEFLKKCNTPNIDSLNPHPAKSLGGMTRAAVPWLLGGFLPHCEIPGCPHNKGLRWSRPFYLTEWKEKSSGVFLYVPNGWVLEFLTPFMTPEFRRKILYWHDRHAEQPTGQMIEDFLQIEPKLKNGYFAYFHCMETHPPFYPPGEQVKEGEPVEERMRRRKLAVEYVDRAISPLLKLDVDDLVITSDHNLAHGSWNEDWFSVFLATRIRGMNI